VESAADSRSGYEPLGKGLQTGGIVTNMCPMLRTTALVAVMLGGCALYGEGETEVAPPSEATAPIADVSGIAECAPAAADYACPPWWLSCSRLQLRQSECQTACTTGERTCAGYDAGECFNDCVAYRYEAYCPL
jgi:hypothetical protein